MQALEAVTSILCDMSCKASVIEVRLYCLVHSSTTVAQLAAGEKITKFELHLLVLCLCPDPAFEQCLNNVYQYIPPSCLAIKLRHKLRGPLLRGSIAIRAPRGSPHSALERQSHGIAMMIAALRLFMR